MGIGINNRALLILFGIAVATRSFAALHQGRWADPLRGMPLEEVLLAQRLATGDGYVTPYDPPGGADLPRYPSAHSPPGFPYLLSGIIRAAPLVSADPLRPYQCAVALGVVFLSEGILGFYGHNGWLNQLLIAAGLIENPLELTHNSIGVTFSLFMQNDHLLHSAPYAVTAA